MDKLKMHSINKVDDNIQRVGKLFPNCLTERINEKGEVEYAIDFDILRQELSPVIVEGNEERYQFTWPDKKKSLLLANAPIAKTLRPCREESVDFDNTENLYIEGDNLDVLKLLQETYLGKIKMIYIDPPYNTGNDFVYEDDFAQSTEEYLANSGQYDEEGNRLVQNNESNGRFHTDWLNMMYPRLKVAKDLLAEDGVVLINMDENEFVNLQRLCVDIFGECNDLGTIVWDKRNPKGDAKGISYQHEYIIVYAKDKVAFLDNCKMQRPKKNAEAILKKAEQIFRKINLLFSFEQASSEFAEWLAYQSDFTGGEKAYNKFDEQGQVFQSVSMAWPNKKRAPEDYFIPLLHPITHKPCPVPSRGWRNPSSTMNKLLSKGLILFGEDENTQPRRKYLLSENMYENIPSLLYYGGSDTVMLEEMGIPFDTPKVVDICLEHIKSFTSAGDIFLDFFSGSSTTAHAVMKLNAEDGGKRKFIMVQLPEETDEKSEAYKAGYKNICELGKERIRRAGKKIKDEVVLTDQNLDTGFRVLKLDSTNMKDVYYNPNDYEATLFASLADNIKADRTPEDLLFQVMLDLGVLLSCKIEEQEINGKKVFNVADGYLIACFDENVTAEIVKAIAMQKPYYFVMRDSSLADDSVATNFEQLFATYSPDTIRKVL
ncbi:MAG: site-specific DNA-methyltransferase [Bacteroidales bacterium 36-12]|nr:MAG: site-specific DNA-methyltransferase [Bacteroidales bacterium 36-12]